MEIFRRKCPRCLKAVSFRAAEERAGGKVKVTTVACTSCGIVVGVLPQLNRLPEKREVESIVRGIVRKHVNAAVKNLRKRVSGLAKSKTQRRRARRRRRSKPRRSAR